MHAAQADPVRAPESLELHLLAGRVELVAARTLPLEHRARLELGGEALAAPLRRELLQASELQPRRQRVLVIWLRRGRCAAVLLVVIELDGCIVGIAAAGYFAGAFGAWVCVLLGEVYAFFGGHLKGLGARSRRLR